MGSHRNGESSGWSGGMFEMRWWAGGGKGVI